MIKNDEQRNIDFKVVVMGDSNVGKTTLLLKYLNGEFIPNLDDTFSGINLFRKQYNMKSKSEEEINYFFNIWDITGSESYLKFISLISERINSVIIQTNADDTKIEHSLRKWLDVLKNSVKIDFLKYLIISTRNNLPLDKVMLRDLLLDYDLNEYFIIDSKNTQQVNTAFDYIFDEVIKTQN